MDSLQTQIEALRPTDADYLLIAVGVRGPNLDCEQGNAVATVRMGNDEATSEALHLRDAISLARGKIIRERKAREDQRAKGKANGGFTVHLNCGGKPGVGETVEDAIADALAVNAEWLDKRGPA